MLKQLPTITCWQEFLLQFEMHLEILSNKYVSRQIADGVLFSKMLKCLVRDGCLLGVQMNSMFVALYSFRIYFHDF